MNNFYAKTLKPFLILAGLYTASAGLLAIQPEAIEALFQLTYTLEYRLLIQHWGFTTLLIGLGLILSTYKTYWQESVFMIAAGEKLYMVVLVLYHTGDSYIAGFVSVAAIDLVISLYLLSYLYYVKQQSIKVKK